MYEELCLERYLGLGVADTDDTSCESHLVDSHIIGYGTSHSLDDYIGSETSRDFLQTGMHILSHGVDGMAGTHLTGQRQFLVVDIRSNHCGTALHTTYDGTHTHHTTADNDYGVDICHLCTTHGMEAYTHGFYQRTSSGRKLACGDNLLPRQGNQFAHGTIALHTKRLVMLTGIHSVVTA